MKITANHITVLRIFLIPFVLFFMFFKSFVYSPFVAFAFYAFAVFTDMWDGRVARRTNTVSTIGKFLDPVSDKIFTTAVMIALIYTGVFFKGGDIIRYVNMACIIVILAREFAVSAIRQVSADKRIIIAADIFGKLKTVVTFVSFGAFILADFKTGDFSLDVLYYTGLVLFYISTLVSVFSGVNYYLKNKHVFRDRS